jgi:hypothetical protein
LTLAPPDRRPATGGPARSDSRSNRATVGDTGFGAAAVRDAGVLAQL